jgi:hypothetical protein
MPGDGLPEYLDDDDWSDEQVDDESERVEKARNFGGDRGGKMDLDSAVAAGRTLPNPSIDFFLMGDDSTSLLLL